MRLRPQPLPRLGPTRDLKLGNLALPFTYVPTGVFWMGDVPEAVRPEDDAQPPHLVRVTHPLWVACAPLSLAQAAALQRAERDVEGVGRAGGEGDDVHRTHIIAEGAGNKCSLCTSCSSFH